VTWVPVLGTLLAFRASNEPLPALTGKEFPMTRIILTLATLGLFAAGIAGCHADADVHPHGSTSVMPAR